MSKRVSTTLLFVLLSVTIALICQTEASARVCIFKIGGTCVLWTGSVQALLTADDFGDISQDPKLFQFSIQPLDPDKGIIFGQLYCKDPNSIAPIMIPNAKFTGTLRDSVKIKEGDKYQCEEKDIAIVAAVAKLDDNQLIKLAKDYCQKPNLEAINFVPYEFYSTIALVSEGSQKVHDQVKYHCKLPEYETLGWDEIRLQPERRQYVCSDIK